MTTKGPKLRGAPALVGVLAALVAIGPACGSGPADPASLPSAPASAPPAAGPPLAAFELTIPQRTPEEAAARAGAVAAVLAHRQIERPSLAALEETLRRTPVAASARLIDAPHVSVGHHPGLDAVWAIDEDVAHDVVTVTDLGVDAATVRFHETLADLESAGLVDSATLDVAGARVSHIIMGSGRGGQRAVESVKEYIFFAPRTINGIAIADAGLRVTVHRSGEVSSIRVEGATAAEKRDAQGRSVPVGAGHAIVRTVSEADLDARVHAENPDADVSPLGLGYWMPRGATTAVVAPRQGYVVYPRVEIAGRTGPGRGHKVLYAVDDAMAAPILE